MELHSLLICGCVYKGGHWMFSCLHCQISNYGSFGFHHEGTQQGDHNLKKLSCSFESAIHVVLFLGGVHLRGFYSIWGISGTPILGNAHTCQKHIRTALGPDIAQLDLARSRRRGSLLRCPYAGSAEAPTKRAFFWPPD